MRTGRQASLVVRLGIVIAALAVGAMAATAVAGAQEKGEGQSEGGPAGVPMKETAPLLATSGSTFDPTILIDFIPGTAFDPYQGGSIEADLVRYESPDSNCVSADSNGGGVLAELRTGVDVPSGARITRLVFYGVDSDATYDIGIRLSRGTVNVPSSGAPARSFTVVDAFSTSEAPGVVAIAGAPGLNSLAGVVPAANGVDHHFHTIHVQLRNSAASTHKLCGVEVHYQVPDVVSMLGKNAQLNIAASGPTANRVLLKMANNGRAFFTVQDTSQSGSWQFGTRGTSFEINRIGSGGFKFRLFENGRVTLGAGPAVNLELSPRGDLRVAGSITDGSGKTLGDLAAENQALRDRIAKLEARLAAIDAAARGESGG